MITKLIPNTDAQYCHVTSTLSVFHYHTKPITFLCTFLYAGVTPYAIFLHLLLLYASYKLT